MVDVATWVHMDETLAVSGGGEMRCLRGHTGTELLIANGMAEKTYYADGTPRRVGKYELSEDETESLAKFMAALNDAAPTRPYPAKGCFLSLTMNDVHSRDWTKGTAINESEDDLVRFLLKLRDRITYP